ncbi:hypothetical protein LCGC14_1223210 [marine sediment metagenome]|uniref:Uncharacterized protein n=1 Tax=marine sediment metagenome TaxID=412755 RepID=A0A0F9PF43_9ZZZZ
MSKKKICTVCRGLLPLKAFHRDRLGKHGKKAACKSCRCAHEQEQSRVRKSGLFEGEQRTRIAIYASTCALADGDCTGEVLAHCPDGERLEETLPICKRHRAWLSRLEQPTTYMRLVALSKSRRR